MAENINSHSLDQDTKVVQEAKVSKTDSALRLVKLVPDQTIKYLFDDYSMLVFILRGSMKVVSILTQNSYSAQSDEMFLIPQSRTFIMQTHEDVELLLCKIPPLLEIFRQNPLSVYAPYVKKIPDELKKRDISWLTVHPVLKEEVNHIVKVLSYFTNSVYFQNNKRETIFIYIKNLYSLEEIAFFSKKLLDKDLHFLALVQSIYRENITAQEFIDSSGMSTCTFYRKFKKTFNMNVGQWLIKKKIQSLVEDLALSDDTIAVIAKKHLVTPNHLAKFCRLQFDLSPTELRMKLREKHEMML